MYVHESLNRRPLLRLLLQPTRVRVALDLADDIPRTGVVDEAQADEVDDLFGGELEAEVALVPEIQDLLQVALQDLTEELESHPAGGVLRRAGDGVFRIRSPGGQEQVVELLDARNKARDVIRLVLADACEVHDVGDELRRDRVDQGAHRLRPRRVRQDVRPRSGYGAHPGDSIIHLGFQVGGVEPVLLEKVMGSSQEIAQDGTLRGHLRGVGAGGERLKGVYIIV